MFSSRVPFKSKIGITKFIGLWTIPNISRLVLANYQRLLSGVDLTVYITLASSLVWNVEQQEPLFWSIISNSWSNSKIFLIIVLNVAEQTIFLEPKVDLYILEDHQVDCVYFLSGTGTVTAVMRKCWVLL